MNRKDKKDLQKSIVEKDSFRFLNCESYFEKKEW